MIEKDPEALKVIIENINDLGFENKCRAYKNDVIRAVEILGKKKEKFDIIFMDPPYKEELCRKVLKAIRKADILEKKEELCRKVLKAIRKADILEKNGLIICEHHIFEDLIADEEGFKFTDRRLYSKKAISFYVNEE